MNCPTETISAGFIPLTDCAPLIVAAEKGFASAEGLDLMLVRETSWATIRDRLAVGRLDVAHILAPMPIAANLGLTPLPSSLIVPMALGLGGNTVTVSGRLWRALSGHGAPLDFAPSAAAQAIAAEVAVRRATGRPRLVFGIVHLFSSHHYELAYWLAHAAVLPDTHVELVVLPPSLMGAALAGGQIDGFCAGEPWGSLAAAEGEGVILTTNTKIWRSSPEKVLGVRREWAEADSGRLARLLRAIHRACLWCDAAENRGELAALLAQPAYLNQRPTVIEDGLAGRLTAPTGNPLPVEGFLNFSAGGATFPWVSHALWLYSQMVRWGQATYSPADAATVRRTYRPDLYRAALAPPGAPGEPANAGALPASAAMSPWLGAGAFFDGLVFDADQLEAYIALQRAPE